MKQLLVLLTLASSLLVACAGTPTPNVAATVQAAVAATQTAQPTESPTPKPTETPHPTPVPTSTSAPTATPIPPTATPIPPTPTAVPPTATLIPPTPTAVPQTATSIPPTLTPVPVQPTATSVPDSPYSGTYTVVNVASDDILNVRAKAGVSHPIVGVIPPQGMGAQITGAGQQVDGALWVPINYEGTTGWVNSNYLARQVGFADGAVAAQAARIIMALKSRDMENLSRLVHPDKGLRFSPYTYVRVDSERLGGADLSFSSAHITNFLADQTVYRWGHFDGSGEPIDLTFAAYFARFVYDADFARPHTVGYDDTIGWGNAINNIAEVYPSAVTVEYHFEGFDPAFAGLDWRSLRLVLEEKDGVWYLVGVVHDEWTT